jgi:Tfp pilus assembly protein PilF
MTAKAGRLSQIGTTYAASASDAHSLMEQAQDSAQRAVELAPLSPTAHVTLGSIYYWTFRFPLALREFQRLQSLGNPSGGDLATVGWMLALLRRFDMGLRLVDEGVALDPLNPDVHRNRANVLQCADRLAEAGQAVQHAIELNPNLWDNYLLYATILLQAGRVAEAQKEIAKVEHGSIPVLATQAIIAERLGNPNESNRLLQEILNSGMLGAAHYQVAEIYAQLNRIDDAFTELERAYAARDPGLAQMLTDFTLDPIRSDPRFQAILRRMNFPS